MLNSEQLAEAEAILRKQWKDVIEDDGGYCPCCNRWGKVNATTLNGPMIRALLWMYRVGGRDWIHIPSQAPRFIITGYHVPSMKYWGFVEQYVAPPLTKADRKAGVTRDKRTSGTWRITEEGIDFLFHGTKVADKVFIYNDTPIQFSDTMVGARECVNKKFNYDAMMNESLAWSKTNG